MIFIVIFFGFKANNFFTATNFVIIIQMAGTTMLAYGVVFVLLLGEIDLSIGYVAGISAWPWRSFSFRAAATTTTG